MSLDDTEAAADPSATDESAQALPHRRLTRAQAKGITRDRLLDSAASVFASKGFNGASLEEIAAQAG